MAFAKRSSVVLALLALAAGSALAGSRSLLETTTEKEDKVILGSDSSSRQEITREFGAMVDTICAYPDGVSANTIEGAMLTNMTDNWDFVHTLAAEQLAYPWAAPMLDDMAWLCKMMTEFTTEREDAKTRGKPLELMFYGDATLQCMRFHTSECEGAEEIFAEKYGEKYNAAVWALGGETTANLLWRMMHGNGPEPDAKAVVLNVGAKDIMSAIQDPETWDADMDDIASRIISNADYLKDTTKSAQVLLMGLLPITGYNDKGLPMEEISPMYRDGIDSINEQLRAYGRSQERVSYIDCIDYFTKEDGGLEIDSKLFSTANVPTAKGFELLTKCIDNHVARYMSPKPLRG